MHSNRIRQLAESQGLIFYRGTNPGSTERIRTGDTSWDSHLFVTDNPSDARWYGSYIEEVHFASTTQMIREGTPRWSQVCGRWRTGNLLLYASACAEKARAAGYDLVWFERQMDVGTAVVNTDKITHRQGWTGTLLTGRYAGQVYKDGMEVSSYGESLGYKSVRLLGDRLISGADSRQTFPAKVGTVLEMPGNGIYIATDENYVRTYYTGLHDREALLTLEYDPKDIVWGKLGDKEDEIAVRRATVRKIEVLEND